MQRNGQMKKTNTTLYVILLIASLVICFASLLFDSANKFFTLCSSVGCSGIVSVIVAWLIEISNNKIQTCRDKEIINRLLGGFDIRVKVEMQRALLNCSKFEDFDIDKNYSIDEIVSLLEKLDKEHVYFRGFPDMIEKITGNVDAIVLLNFEKSETGMNLYSEFVRIQEYLNTMNFLGDDKDISELIKIFVIEIIKAFGRINTLREINDRYEIPEDSKGYIKRIQEIKKKKSLRS